MKPNNVKCLCCGKETYVRPYRLKTFKYCSRDCKDKSNIVEITANCAICQKQFTHISSRCNKAKYCSRKCYYHSIKYRGNKEYTCFHCGKLFIDHIAHKRKYCSQSCKGKQKRETWKPHYTTIRYQMLKDGLIKACQICGYNEIKNILGVHHIDRNRENNSPENLQVLCPNCHSIIHNKHICHGFI